MELEYLKTANNALMWISVLPPVALVVVQAFMFQQRAVKDGRRMGVTDLQMKTAAKSAFFASLGPSVVIVIGMVGLLTSVGGPVAWMRLAYIGSVMYELPAADRAATAAGSTLGTSDMTMAAYANAVWIMTVCCLGWIIISALFTDKMGILRDKVAGDSQAALGVIATAGGLGGMSFQVFTRFFNLVKEPFSISFSVQTWTIIAAAIIMFLMNTYANKSKAAWAQQFGITIAMVGGMTIGAFFLIGA